MGVMMNNPYPNYKIIDYELNTSKGLKWNDYVLLADYYSEFDNLLEFPKYNYDWFTHKPINDFLTLLNKEPFMGISSITILSVHDVQLDKRDTGIIKYSFTRNDRGKMTYTYKNAKIVFED